MLLVDGGVMSNAPVGIAREMSADIILAVDGSGDIKRRKKETFKTPFNTAWRVFRIAQNHIYEKELKSGDLIVKTGLGLDTLDFSKNKECIMKGEEDMEKEIKKLKELSEE